LANVVPEKNSATVHSVLAAGKYSEQARNLFSPLPTERRNVGGGIEAWDGRIVKVNCDAARPLEATRISRSWRAAGIDVQYHFHFVKPT